MTEITPHAHVWSVGGQSAMGASHVRYGIPNQDAIAWRPRGTTSTTAVLALADGHGAKAHFRSGAGAHIAIDVAIQVLTEALAEPSWIKAADDEVMHRLVRDIVSRWQSAVISDLAARPLSPNQKTSFENQFIPYGTTLIAAAVAPEGTVVLQLGDGDMLLGTADGVVFRPLADDEGLFGEQTFSLCLPDAVERTRTAVFPAREEDIDFVMLSTDGLAKSFANKNAFVRHAASWRLLIGNGGLSAVSDKLERWLTSASQYGSGDDITLGFMTRGDESSARAGLTMLPQETEPAPTVRPAESFAFGLSGAGVLAVVVAGFLFARWMW
jgi:serine/threonine protein phosphatase PrpC